MQNIYEKIDTMFSGENDDRPSWATEILDELREIKELLQSTKSKKQLVPINSHQLSTTKQVNVKSYYGFINELRETYMDCKDYPYDIYYEDKVIGIRDGGLLYNKLTNYIFSTQQAKDIYRGLYQQNLSDNSVLSHVA